MVELHSSKVLILVRIQKRIYEEIFIYISITQILILFPKSPLFTENVSKDRLKNYEREGKVLF